MASRTALPFQILVALFFLASNAANAQPARVVDGDTIEMGSVRYRLNGIDAPEHGQACGNWRCGDEATAHLAAMIDGQDIDCAGTGTDGYGRILATCFAGDVDLLKRMIEDGFAWAFVKYSRVYELEEAAARNSGVGVWQGNFQAPWDFRSEKWAVAIQTAPSGCPIKCNISGNGKIYHAPWSPWYSKTKVTDSKGERWFCTEGEAVEAGWRAPLWK